MKTLPLCLLLMACVSASYAQKLEKGAVVGTHVGTIKLNPDVTFNQYKNFFLTKYIPEINKAFAGDMVVYFAVAERSSGGANDVTIIYLFKSVEARNKYFPSPEKVSDLFTSIAEKFKMADQELDKLGSYSEKHYYDWIVQ